MSAPHTHPDAHGDAGRTLAGSALCYGLAVTLGAKLARTLQASAAGGTRMWAMLPLSVAEDILVVLGLALVCRLLGRMGRPRLRVAAAVTLLVPFGVLHAIDVSAHRVTGGPLTLPQLRGDEGATLGDLNLLESVDLWAGVARITGALALLALVLAWPRVRDIARRTWAPRPVAALLTAALLSWGLRAATTGHAYGLEQQAVLAFVGSFTSAPRRSKALDAAGWKRLLRPATPADRPMTRPPSRGHARNVVVFLAEGIPFEHTSFSKRHSPGPTPNLLRRVARDGLLFDRYYANWHASNQAIFSVVCATYPPIGGDIVRVKPRIDCGEFSEVMHAAGLEAALIHGGSFSFYNKLALLGDRSYALAVDADGLLAKGGWQRMHWGVDDGAVAKAALDFVDSLPAGQPFALLLIPITAHYPFDVPKRFRRRPWGTDGRMARFLTAVRFQDQVFEELLQGFEARGLYEDTLFAWLGDHGAHIDEPPRLTTGNRSFYEASLHTPLALINPRMFPEDLPREARVSSRPGSHVDLLPTLLDAVGAAPDARHQGQSLLSSDYVPRRVFFGAQSGRYVGFVEHDHKFALRLEDDRTEYYDLTRDPEELENLSERFPGRMARYASDAKRLSWAVRAWIEDAPMVEGSEVRGTLTDRFVTKVRMFLRRDKTHVPCHPSEDRRERHCGELGRLLWVERTTLQGADRQCVMVKVPKGYMAFLDITEPGLVRALTGTTPVVSEQTPPEGGFRVRARVDGKGYPWQHVTGRQLRYVRHPRGERTLRYAVGRREDPLNPPALCLDLLGQGAKK